MPIEGHINSPTVYNSSFNIKQFWDGRADDLEAQASGPVHNPAEMGSNWDEVIFKLQKDPYYVKQFKKVYGAKMSGATIAKAIASFEKSLVTYGNRFDNYISGKGEVLDPDEMEGFKLFKKYSCNNCHVGVAFGANSFQKMGAVRDYFKDRVAGANNLEAMPLSNEDYGRYNVTKLEEDRYKFKIPTLRNIKDTHPYLHDGTIRDLERVVEIMAEYQLGKKLSDDEVDKITKFLKTL